MQKNIPVVWTLVLALFTMTSAACGLVDLRDHIKVKSPVALGHSEALTVNESKRALEAYKLEQEILVRNWTQDIAKKEGKILSVESFTFAAWEEVSPWISGLGPAGILAAGIGGMFIRRPGDQSGRDAQQVKDELNIQRQNVQTLIGVATKLRKDVEQLRSTPESDDPPSAST